MNNLKQVTQSEEKFRHLFEKAPVGIYITDRTGAIINANPACLSLLGYGSLEDLLGIDLCTIFALSDDWRKFRDVLEKQGATDGFDTRLKRKNGMAIDARMTATVRGTLTGKLSGFEGFISDITALKKSEAEHRKDEEKYRTVLDNSLGGIYMYQDGGRFTYVNPKLIKMMGYDNAAPIIGKPFWEFIHPEDRELVKERGLAREKAEFYPSHYTFRILHKKGKTIWVDMRASHATYMGRPAVVGNFIDITRTKEAEERVRMLSRSLIDVIEEERKSLAADLHDEFGQTLTSLKFEVENLQKQITGQGEGTRALCESIICGIRDLGDNIRATTAKLRPDLLDHLGLVPTLESYVNDLKKIRPELRIRFQTMGFKKRLDPAREIVLYRIFQESVNNVLRHSGADEVDIFLTCSHPKLIFVCRDNGRGFDFSKDGLPGEKAMGIGLLSMKERTDGLKGKFTLKSAMGKGTTVRIELPLAEKA